MSIFALAKTKKLKFELLPHPRYSSNSITFLTLPSKFYVFSNLKKWFGVKIFSDDNQVINVVNGYFEDFNKSAYQSGLAESF